MVELLSRGNVVGREMARQHLGVRQPSGALASPATRGKSARGLAHSKTLTRHFPPHDVATAQQFYHQRPSVKSSTAQFFKT